MNSVCKSKFVAMLSLFSFLTLLAPWGWCQQQGKPIDLGTLPGGSWSEAWGINGNGDVVGMAGNADGNTRPFFVATRGPKAFQMLDLGTFGGERTDAWVMSMDINNSGLVVGHAPTATGEVRPWAWSKSMPMTDLGTLPGHTHGAASGVNDLGLVVGWSGLALDDDCSSWVATAWLLEPLSNSWKINALEKGSFGSNFLCWEAMKTNRLGQIVGNAIDMSFWGYSAFLWNPLPGGGWKVAKLDGVPGYAMTMAHGINGRGEISGHVIAEDWSLSLAVVWRPTSPDRTTYQVQVLPSLTDPPQGWAVAESINDVGDAVGFSADSNWVDQAVRWSGNPTPSIHLLGLSWGYFHAVNNSGIAAGGAVDPESGGYHAFIVPFRRSPGVGPTPIP